MENLSKLFSNSKSISETYSDNNRYTKILMNNKKYNKNLEVLDINNILHTPVWIFGKQFKNYDFFTCVGAVAHAGFIKNTINGETLFKINRILGEKIFNFIISSDFFSENYIKKTNFGFDIDPVYLKNFGNKICAECKKHWTNWIYMINTQNYVALDTNNSLYDLKFSRDTVALTIKMLRKLEIS